MGEVTWGCVGGNPADYLSLHGQWNDCGREDIGRVSRNFAKTRLTKAITNVDEAVGANERLNELFTRFKVSAEVPCSALRDMKLVRQSPDKVLRVVQRQSIAVGEDGSGGRILIPADAATALVLRFGLRDTPSTAKLKAMVESRAQST